MSKREACLLFVFILLWTTGNGQALALGDSVIESTIPGLSRLGPSPLAFRFVHDVDYNLSASGFFPGDNTSHDYRKFTVIHTFRYVTRLIKVPWLNITQVFVHNLGLEMWPDKLTRFTTDENTLDTRFEITPGKILSFTVISSLSTRLFRNYDRQDDGNGSILKNPVSSFLTPLTWNFSLCLGFRVPDFLTLSVGLSSARLTWLREQRWLEQNGQANNFGISAGQKSRFDYGLSLNLLIDRNLGRWGHWNCDVNLFKEGDASVDLLVKNLLDISLTRFIQTTIQTKLVYDEDLQPFLQTENIITLGLNIHF